MDCYFVKREVISLLHAQLSFDLLNLNHQNMIALRSEIPEGDYVGDQCLFNVGNSIKPVWTYAKVVWQDFDLEKFNIKHTNIYLTYQFKSKYYLFTPFEGLLEDVEHTLQSLSDFAYENKIELKGGIIIIPDMDDDNTKDPKVLELDIFIPVMGKIPDILLKQYQPYSIRRKKYNFYTY